VRDDSGNRTAGEVVLEVTPADGVTIETSAARFDRTGTFELACALADGSLRSEPGQTITVTPADLAVLETVLSTDTIAPNGAVDVSCNGRDRFGNTVPLDRVITAPVDGLTALDERRMRLTGTRAGLYAITCLPQDAWIKAQTAPAQLEIVPGEPATMVLNLSPDRAVYSVGQRVLLTPVVHDAFANPITTLNDAISIEARHNNVLKQTLTPGSRVNLDAEGFWTLRASLAGSRSLTAQRQVAADASAPTIDISNPTRGSMVTATGASMTLSGEARDATGGLAEVTIDGAAQTLVRGVNVFPIAKSFLPRHGVNSFTLTARDVGELFTRTAQSFLAAPGWKPAGEAFDEGIQAHLDRTFLDDGTRTGSANDLATIFERVLGAMDVSSFLPSPAVTYGGYDVYLRNMRHDKPTVTIAPSLDALRLVLNVRNIGVDVNADGFVDVNGRVTASEINIDMLLSVTVVNGQARVRQQSTTVRVDGLRIDVHWSINWLVNLFSNTISNQLADAVKTQIVQMVPPLLEDVLKSIELNETFTVPAFFPGMQPLNIALTAKLQSAKVTESGIDVALRTRAAAARRVNWATRGSIVRGGCFGVDGGPPVWDPAKRIGAAIPLDVINQVLHAVWQGAGLEFTMGPSAFGGIDLEGEYGITNLNIALSGRLPPLLTDCGGKLVLQMSELHMDVTSQMNGQPLDVSMILSVETGANVVMQNGKLTLALEAIPPEAILVDIVDVDTFLFDANQEVELIEFLRELVLVKALEQVGGQTLADFPLPSIDLGALDPSLSGNVISFASAQLTRRRGFLTLSTDP
jgi:hypothetical protein